MLYKRLYLAGVDWDQRTRKRGVYKIVEKDHKGWSPNVDNELGNYDYLLGADVRSFIRALTPHS
jgi:alpha-amylase